ncbi:MAG: hypothetical protein K0S68_1001 [Candidatus Saccharibacteria bacterium]|jgi:hypothetical protein|nr:hypothetical protein [Candidatus Saccharibacteria bacterium]
MYYEVGQTLAIALAVLAALLIALWGVGKMKQDTGLRERRFRIILFGSSALMLITTAILVYGLVRPTADPPAEILLATGFLVVTAVMAAGSYLLGLGLLTTTRPDLIRNPDDAWYWFALGLSISGAMFGLVNQAHTGPSDGAWGFFVLVMFFFIVAVVCLADFVRTGGIGRLFPRPKDRSVTT